MEAGADDNLIKPFDAHELEVRLRAGRRILELQQQLISAREASRVQAQHDPLTAVLNRGAIVELLAAEVLGAKRERRGIALADVDHFNGSTTRMGTQPATKCCAKRAAACARRCGRMTRSADMAGKSF